ncbi:MAG: sigma factor, partial [Oscillospiraceae bacterium]
MKFDRIFSFFLQKLYLLAKNLNADSCHYINGPEILPAPLTPAEELIVMNNIRSGVPGAREPLITHNLRLVVYIAKKFDSPGASTEDLISIGTIGLIKAVNTFSLERNIKLATYASRCIENEILM